MNSEKQMKSSRRAILGMVAAAGLVGKQANAQFIAPSVPNTFDITKWPGVVVGAGQSSGQRTANGTALQAVFNYCGANKLLAVHPGGVLEYTATGTQSAVPVGLQVPYNALGLVGLGPTISRFVQFATNFPALTLGDVNGSNQTGFGKYTDFSVGFGTDQTGQTSGIGLQWGSHFQSTFNNLIVNPFIAGGGRVEAYIGLSIPNIGGSFFACVIPSIQVLTGLQSFFSLQANGTGNVWGEMYLGGGGASDLRQCVAPFVAANTTNFGTISLLNLEWCQPSGNVLINLNNVRGFTAAQVRFEGCKLTGNGPAMILAALSEMVIGALNIYDVVMLAADFSGNPNIIFADFGSSIEVQSGSWLWNQIGDGSGQNTSTWGICNATETFGRCAVSVSNIAIGGYTGTFNPDPNNLLAPVGGAVQSFGKYTYNAEQSTLDQAVVVAPSGNGPLTMYGSCSNMQLQINTPITGNLSAIWADAQAASGFGAALPTNSPDTLEVVRGTGCTGAFNVLVRNGANNTTVATLATAGTTSHVARSGATLTAF